MSIPQLRVEVTNFIKKADNQFLKMVHAMAVAYSHKEIVGYTTHGIPLTKDAYIGELDEARQDIHEGRVLTTSELKKRIHTWKKIKKLTLFTLSNCTYIS